MNRSAISSGVWSIPIGSMPDDTLSPAALAFLMVSERVSTDNGVSIPSLSLTAWYTALIPASFSILAFSGVSSPVFPESANS